MFPAPNTGKDKGETAVPSQGIVVDSAAARKLQIQEDEGRHWPAKLQLQELKGFAFQRCATGPLEEKLNISLRPGVVQFHG